MSAGSDIVIPTDPAVGEPRERLRVLLARKAPIVSIGLFLIIVLVAFGLASPQFFTSENLLAVIRQSAPALVVAVGSTLVITAAGIDLSVGSLVSFTGTLGALMMTHGISPTIALILTLLAGLLVGAANGYFIAFQRLPAFIVTLASLSLVAGAAQAMAKGFSIAINGNWVVSFTQGSIGSVPTTAVFAVVFAIIGWLILERTPYGRHLQGIGSNEEAVRRAGVRTNWSIAGVYAISGLASGIGGVLVAAQLQSGGATNGTGLELQVIAAVVLGGTSIFGGEGTILGTVLGVLTIAYIGNGLIIEQVQPFYVSMIQGGILLIAVFANTRIFSRWISAADVPPDSDDVDGGEVLPPEGAGSRS